jgi:protein SCO1/2
MLRRLRHVLPLLVLLATACRSTPDHLRVKDDLADASWDLLDQDSTVVTFPDDFRGATTLVGYVYTHCPDVCPLTTANMQKVRAALGPEDNLRLVSISFDPARDTPSTLKSYANAWGVDGPDWRFLTGDSTTIADLMERMAVRYEIAPPPVSRQDLASPAGTPATVYFINHSDQVTLLDRQGRVVGVYGGSSTPPDILVEDVQALP